MYACFTGLENNILMYMYDYFHRVDKSFIFFYSSYFLNWFKFTPVKVLWPLSSFAGGGSVPVFINSGMSGLLRTPLMFCMWAGKLPHMKDFISP
jgi:hypothetical protein